MAPNSPFLLPSNSLSLYPSIHGPHKFRGIIRAMNDTTSLSKATILFSSFATQLAVLCATTHQPLSKPPDPCHIVALLAFKHDSCIATTASIFALTTYFRSTRDPAVALKSLLALLHLLAPSAFILHDQLLAALLHQPTSDHNPLTLPASAFPLAAWADWLVRLLELLLVVAATTTTATFPPSHHHNIVDPHSSNDHLASLLN